MEGKNQEETTMRRRRRPLGVIILSTTLLLSPQLTSGWGLGAHMADQERRSLVHKRTRLSSDPKSDHVTRTWSGPGGTSSRLKVRNRVRAVLEKAKKRTGLQNNSTDMPGLWVAEAASIGGIEEEGDVLLDFVNGDSNGATATASLVSAADNDLSSEGEPDPVDGIRADVPVYVDPLPFTLPNLSDEQKEFLRDGGRIEEQSKMGRAGSGFVCVDVKAPPHVIWEALLDFEKYPEMIGTVREMTLFTSGKLKSGYHREKPVPCGSGRSLRHFGIPSVTRAKFVLSKFKLNIAAIHNYRPHPEGDYMVFTLDPDCTNMVLQSAKGIWHTETNPDSRGEEYTRVWLLCELKVSKLLPSFIVDYTARKAMPRASAWLKPYVEEMAQKW